MRTNRLQRPRSYFEFSNPLNYHWLSVFAPLLCSLLLGIAASFKPVSWPVSDCQRKQWLHGIVMNQRAIYPRMNVIVSFRYTRGAASIMLQVTSWQILQLPELTRGTDLGNWPKNWGPLYRINTHAAGLSRVFHPSSSSAMCTPLPFHTYISLLCKPHNTVVHNAVSRLSQATRRPIPFWRWFFSTHPSTWRLVPPNIRFSFIISLLLAH